MKTYKGEKYAYLLMGYLLAQQTEGKYVDVGEDKGMKGGQNYWRSFRVQHYGGKTLLEETKTSSHCANYARLFEITNAESTTPTIRDYINESGDNCGQRWEH
jgi:hypothetical protein